MGVHISRHLNEDLAWATEQVNILISKNQALQILYLKHHNNKYKTS